jgi:hypothetical protein
MNYWILFNNPDTKYDLPARLLRGELTFQYEVQREHENDIKVGDYAIHRVGGSSPGIYALSRVVEPARRCGDVKDPDYKNPEEAKRVAPRVVVEVWRNLVRHPLSLDRILVAGIEHPLLQRAPRGVASAPLDSDVYRAIEHLCLVSPTP